MAYLLRIRDGSPDVCSSYLGAEPNLRFVDGVAGLEQRVVVELAEAPGQQPVGLVGARLHAGQAVHHQDQPPPVLYRRGGQAVAGIFRVPGLQAVGADVAVEQRVAVALADAVPGTLLQLGRASWRARVCKYL